MDIDKFIKDKGLKVDCIVESDLDVKEYVQYEVRDLIKEAVNEQLRLCIVSQQRELFKSFLEKVVEETEVVDLTWQTREEAKELLKLFNCG